MRTTLSGIIGFVLSTLPDQKLTEKQVQFVKRYLDRALSSDNLLQFIDTGKAIKNIKKTVFGYKYLIKIDQQLEDGMILFLFNT